MRLFISSSRRPAMASRGKPISKKALSLWEDDLKSNFQFIYDDSGEKIVMAKCVVCRKHVDKIRGKYQGKLINDVTAYGVEGTVHIQKTNLRRHVESEGHRKCLSIETGEPVDKRQKTLTAAFGTAKAMARTSLRPLLVASLYIGRSEKPYSEFPKILEMCGDMGFQLTTSFSNDKAAKVFNHSIADQMVNDLRKEVALGNFCSFLIDGSSAAKHKLTYEAELLYIRSAYKLKPTTELLCLIPMKSYGSVNAANLFHAVLKELIKLSNTELKEPTDEITTDTLVETLKETNFHLKVIGGGADGASVNFGSKRGLMQLYRESVGEWIVGIHCFSHRLELAAKDALKPHFEDINEFLKSLHLHFRNSPKQWSLLLKLAEKINLYVLVQPRAYGTRFLPHLSRALSVLRTNWSVYIMHFSDAKSQNVDKDLAAKATAWLKKLLSLKFLVRCRIYEDIVGTLSITANIFQTDDARSISDAYKSFETAKAEQELLAADPGEFEQDVWRRLSDAESNLVSPEDLPLLSVSTRASRAAGDTQSVENSVKIVLPCKKLRLGASDPNKPKSRSKYIDSDAVEAVTMTNRITSESATEIRMTAIESLTTALNERFSEFDNQIEVMSKLSFIDVTLWPQSLKDLVSFGVEDIQWLLDHFRRPLQAADIASDVDVLREFRMLKTYYSPRLQTLKLLPKDFWPMVYQNHGSKYKSILLLVEIILCMPFSTAVVERGFSAVRRILTDWRSNLSPALLSDCLHFCTRKTKLADKTYRDQLINHACDSFLDQHEQTSARDGLGMLTKRRINKILNGLECNKDSESEVEPGQCGSSQSLSSDLQEISNQSDSECDVSEILSESSCTSD